MSLFDISSILDDLEQGAIDSAKSIAAGLVEEASSDAVNFVTKALPEISRYISLFLSKQISLDEFKSLMMGLLDLAEMNGLTEAGLAEIEIDKTRNAVLQTVTSLVTGVVSKLA